MASVEATKRLAFQTLHAIQDSGACVNVCDWQIWNIRFSWGGYSWYCLLLVCWQSGRKGWKGRWTGRLTGVFVHQSKVRCDSSTINLPLSSSCQRPCSSVWQAEIQFLNKLTVTRFPFWKLFCNFRAILWYLFKTCHGTCHVYVATLIQPERSSLSFWRNGSQGLSHSVELISMSKDYQCTQLNYKNTQNVCLQ